MLKTIVKDVSNFGGNREAHQVKTIVKATFAINGADPSIPCSVGVRERSFAMDGSKIPITVVIMKPELLQSAKRPITIHL